MTQSSLTTTELGANDLKKIRSLVGTKESAEARLEAAKEAVKEAQDHLNNIDRVLIPDMLLEYGIREFTFEDGSALTIKPFFSVKVAGESDEDKEENKLLMLQWLKDHGGKDIVKCDIVLPFKVSEKKEMKAALKIIKEAELPYINKESVHPSTMKAFVKSLYDGGDMTNLTIDGADVFVGNTAVVSKPKTK
jgi:flavin-binding protein dodecin